MVGAFLTRLTALPLKLCLVFGIVFGAGMTTNTAPAQAGCCYCCPWSITTIIGGGTLLNGLRDNIVGWLTDNFNTLFTLAFGDTESNSGQVLNTNERNVDAVKVNNADLEGIANFNVAVQEAIAKNVAIEYSPSTTVCTTQLDRVNTLKSANQAVTKRSGLSSASTSYVTGNAPLTSKGPVGTVAGQYSRIATQFFNPSWTCPSGMTCGNIDGGKALHLDPNNAIFSDASYQLAEGTPNEIAAKLWVDLVSTPVPPDAVNGDQLALPASRANLRVTRGYTLAVNVQRDIINDVLANRMVKVGVDEPSVTNRLYLTLSDAEEKHKRANQNALDSQAANVAAIGTEVDRLNYAYWQLFVRLEKMALVRALQIKDKLESESGVLNNDPLPAAMRAS